MRERERVNESERERGGGRNEINYSKSIINLAHDCLRSREKSMAPQISASRKVTIVVG